MTPFILYLLSRFQSSMCEGLVVQRFFIESQTLFPTWYAGAGSRFRSAPFALIVLVSFSSACSWVCSWFKVSANLFESTRIFLSCLAVMAILEPGLKPSLAKNRRTVVVSEIELLAANSDIECRSAQSSGW